MNLAREAARLYDENDSDGLFQLAERSWLTVVGDGFPEGIGEVCRFASIRATELNRIDQYLWRARALTAAVITGARNTAAGLLLQHFFTATARAAGGRVGGHEHGHPQARLILEEMKRLVPDLKPFARLYHEKRAVSFLMEAKCPCGKPQGHEGTRGGVPLRRVRLCLKNAETEYSAALAATKGKRGALKVRGGLALVRYLQLEYGPQEGVGRLKGRLLKQTTTIERAATRAGYRDVAGWAAINAGVMRRGEFRGWTAYEIF